MKADDEADPLPSHEPATAVTTGPRKRGGVELAPETEVGRFTIVRRLGAGGMGVVFLARDRELDRDVALKLLRADPGAVPTASAQRRMLREARAMAAVSHPNLVVIYEAGVYLDHVFLAMEYVEGRTLDAWVAEEDRPIVQVVDVFEQAGSALARLHDAGIVHRDFKPDNVLVDREGHATLLDLGIARRLPIPDAVASSAAAVLEARRTGAELGTLSDSFAEGATIGTPAYMSPEQLLGSEVEPAADQFSFGIALYEALCGRPPFTGRTELEKMSATIAGEVRPWDSETADVPEQLRAVIERMLGGEPEARYPSMAAATKALREALGPWRQLRFLTDRWLRHGRSDEVLLSDGELLRKGRALLAERPGDLDDDVVVYLRESFDRISSRTIQRRVMVGSVAALSLGLVPALYLLRSRTRELERASAARVGNVVDAISQRVDALFAEGAETLELMVDQREVWLPSVDDLWAEGEVGSEGLTQQLSEAARRLNRYFLPILRRSPILSSLMVASEDFEFLAFDDPGGDHLESPYRFYNRVVRTDAFGAAAFQLFTGEAGVSRASWLRLGDEGLLGARWQGYDPGSRIFQERAAPAPEIGWTEPYLFFITKEAGLTGASRFEHRGKSLVLAVDITLTDLSAITRGVRGPGVRAVVLTRGDEVVALPSDPRFPSRAAVRRFFATFDAEREGDEAAVLPRLSDLNRPRLVDVWEELGAGQSGVRQMTRGDEELWVGVRPVGTPEQNLTALVVVVAEE